MYNVSLYIWEVVHIPHPKIGKRVKSIRLSYSNWYILMASIENRPIKCICTVISPYEFMERARFWLLLNLSTLQIILLKDRRPNLDMNFDNDNVPGHDFCKPHSGCLRKGRKDICTAFVQNVAFCVDVMSCDHPFCSRIYHS